MVELLAPALLAALIVVETVGDDDGLDPDAAIAGVAAAGVRPHVAPQRDAAASRSRRS